MSSKLLYTLKDENNPNMQKQIGCMNGFFQKIYCHQFLTGRRQKIPPAKEKQRTSIESSRTSLSSSSCSSSFSSLECNRIDPPLSVKTITTQEKPQNPIFKHVDSPRPLQSRGLRDAPRFSFDGRVSQDRFKSLKIKELPRLSLDSKQSTMRQNPQKSSVVAKLMGIEAFPVEETRFKAYPDEKVGSLSRSGSKLSGSVTSVHGEIERRLVGVEFMKSGKDLGAVKRVLEAMSERRRDHSDDQEKLQRSPVGNRRGSTRRDDRLSGDGVQSLRSMQSLKSPRLGKKESGSSVSRKRVISQVTTGSGIPRTKQKRKSPNSLQRSSKVRDLRSHGNANRACSASHVRTEATSTKKNVEFKLIASRAVAEPGGGVTSEQPSPISVLNATFYRDESPSPVKKPPNISKGNGPLNSVSQMAQDESTTLLAEDSNEEHRYICKILLASGLLRDLANGKALNPISLQVFFAVEHSMALSHQNPVQKIHRKLVFDAINEVIELKLVPEKFRGRRRRWVQGEELLREVCSEIDQLEVSKWSCGFDDHEDDDSLGRILRGDLMFRSTEWDDYGIEMFGIVSDIGRLIFRDLIGEVVNGETVGLRIRLCRRLFYQ